MLYCSKKLLFTSLLIPIFISSADGGGANKCKLRGMSGSHHKEICSFVDKFKVDLMEKQPLVILNPQENRILLYGAPGNGKTTYAKMLAKLTNRKYIEVNAANIVEAYPGKGAQKLLTLFADAKAEAQKTGQPVLIFFDEIQSLTAYVELEHRTEHRSTASQLWTLLDKYATDFDFVFVFATNTIDKITSTFLGRFMGIKIIEVAKPNDDYRLALITSFFLPDDQILERNVLINLIRGYGKAYCELLETQIQKIKGEQESLKNLINDPIKYKALSVFFEALEEYVCSCDALFSSGQCLAEEIRLAHEQLGHIKQCISNINKQLELSTIEVPSLKKALSALEILTEKHFANFVSVFNIMDEIDKIVGKATLQGNDLQDEVFKNLLQSKLATLLKEKEVLEESLVNHHRKIKNSDKLISYAYAFINQIKKYEEYLRKLLQFSQKMPSKEFIKSINNETSGLSIRSLVNLKSKICELGNFSLNEEHETNSKQWGEFLVAVKEELSSGKHWTKEDTERANQLLKRFELYRAYKQIECGEYPLSDCSERVKRELGYSAMKNELHEMFQR